MSVLQRFDFYNMGAVPAPTVTYTATKAATASCAPGSTGPDVSRTETRTSTSSQEHADELAQQAAFAAATAALVCTLNAPTFNTVLNPGEYADVVTYNGAPGSKFKFNAPLPAGAPSPATMAIYIGTEQVGQVDFNGNVVGAVCGFEHNGQNYTTTFQNGNITLS